MRCDRCGSAGVIDGLAEVVVHFQCGCSVRDLLCQSCTAYILGEWEAYVAAALAVHRVETSEAPPPHWSGVHR